MASSYSITIRGLAEVQQRFATMSRRSQSIIRAEMEDGMNEIVSRAKQNAPADQGILRNSISYNKTGDLEYTVVSAADYSEFVEFGTRSQRRVPPDIQKIATVQRSNGTPGSAWKMISEWCRRKGIDSKFWYAIYLSIMAKGIAPHPYFYPAIKAVTPKLIGNLKKLASSL